MKYNFSSAVDRRKSNPSKWLKVNNTEEDFVLPMSTADMDFELCKEIRDDLTGYISEQVLGYSRPTKEYLESVVEFFKSHHGFNIRKEWIFTTPGVVSALATAIGEFTNVGDKVIIMTPIYPPFYDVVKGQGRQVSECPMIFKDGNYFIDFELLEKQAEEAKLILFCSPHNPSGRVWDVEELEKLGKICIDNGLVIVSDEIHSDIMLSEKKHRIIGTISSEVLDNSIICTAASKTFNIAGLQCSNIIIANEKIRSRFIAANEKIGLERANVLGMVATQSAYTNGQAWIEEVTEVIKENLRVLVNFLEKYNNLFSYVVPQASFLVWISYEKMGIDENKMCELLDEAKCYVNLGSEYGHGGEGHIRINLGLPEKYLTENLMRLEAVLKKHKYI